MKNKKNILDYKQTSWILYVQHYKQTHNPIKIGVTMVERIFRSFSSCDTCWKFLKKIWLPFFPSSAFYISYVSFMYIVHASTAHTTYRHFDFWFGNFVYVITQFLFLTHRYVASILNQGWVGIFYTLIVIGVFLLE